MTDCYCLVVDMMGFSDTILNLKGEDQVNRVDQWVEVVQEAMTLGNRRTITKYSLISDTVFAKTSNTAEDLEKLVIAAKNLLENGAKNSFPVRGTITFGEVYWEGNIQHGKAISEAYRYTEMQDWVGIIVKDVKEEDLLYCYEKQLLIKYPVPMKSGPVKAYPVVDWTVPGGSDLFNLFSLSELSEDEGINWNVMRKVENTQLFRLYKEFDNINNINHLYSNGVTRISLITHQLQNNAANLDHSNTFSLQYNNQPNTHNNTSINKDAEFIANQIKTALSQNPNVNNYSEHWHSILNNFEIHNFPFIGTPIESNNSLVLPLIGVKPTATGLSEVHYEWFFTGDALRISLHFESKFSKTNTMFSDLIQTHYKLLNLNKDFELICEPFSTNNWYSVYYSIPYIFNKIELNHIAHEANILMCDLIERTWNLIKPYLKSAQ